MVGHAKDTGLGDKMPRREREVDRPTPSAPPKFAYTKLAEGGRLVIPADMRNAMGLKPGDTVTLEVQDGVLTVLTARAAVRQVQERLAPYRRSGESIVDEFLAEKRAEVAREEEETRRWLDARAGEGGSKA